MSGVQPAAPRLQPHFVSAKPPNTICICLSRSLEGTKNHPKLFALYLIAIFIISVVLAGSGVSQSLKGIIGGSAAGLHLIGMVIYFGQGKHIEHNLFQQTVREVLIANGFTQNSHPPGREENIMEGNWYFHITNEKWLKIVGQEQDVEKQEIMVKSQIAPLLPPRIGNILGASIFIHRPNYKKLMLYTLEEVIDQRANGPSFLIPGVKGSKKALD